MGDLPKTRVDILSYAFQDIENDFAEAFRCNRTMKTPEGHTWPSSFDLPAKLCIWN